MMARIERAASPPPAIPAHASLMSTRNIALALASAALLAAAPAHAQATDSASVYELSAVSVAPRPLNMAEFAAALNASYPAPLRAAGVTGRVQTAFVLGPDGVPRDVRISESTDTAFNAPTLAAVQTLRFSPAQVNGRSVSVHVELPIQWRLAAPVQDSAAAPAPPRVEENVYELSQVQVKPRPLNVVELQGWLERNYPPALRDAGVSGIVQVRFVVAADGTTRDFSITQSTNAEFNAATILALTALRFRPARVHGHAVPVYVELPIQWQVADLPLGATDSSLVNPR
jgi:TonB family protein